MKKQITERLRDLIPNGYGHFSEYTQTLVDAIDEIENLRRKLREIRKEYKELIDAYGHDH